MAWVKLDDKFPDHPKVIAAGERAAWLYVVGLCHCNRVRTDGYIAAGVVRRLTAMSAPAKLAARLVDVGLWERVDGGYRVHDYAECQPTTESRAAAAQRVADWRARQREGPPPDPDVTRNGTGTTPVTSGVFPARAPGRGEVRSEGSSKGKGDVDARANEGDLPTLVAEVAGVLHQSPRIFVDVVGVENAIAAWPKRDHVKAARTVVTWVTDPAFRTTNGAKLLFDALSRQPAPPEEAPVDERTKRRRRNHAALKQVQAEAAAQAAGA